MHALAHGRVVNADTFVFTPSAQSTRQIILSKNAMWVQKVLVPVAQLPKTLTAKQNIFIDTVMQQLNPNCIAVGANSPESRQTLLPQM